MRGFDYSPFYRATVGFDRVFDVHIRGTRAITKAAWPHLVRSGAGRIVNVCSTEGLVAARGGGADGRSVAHL